MTDDFNPPIDDLAIELVSKASAVAGNPNPAVQQVAQSFAISGEQIELVRSHLPESACLQRPKGTLAFSFVSIEARSSVS
jgi:hypothetical protein